MRIKKFRQGRRGMKDKRYFIVYVEDSPVAREMVRDSLEGTEFLLEMASDVADLEKRILSDEDKVRQVDLFIFDFDMPEMTGTQIATVLEQAYQELKGTPFVIFSGRPREEVVQAIEDAYSYSRAFAKNFKAYVEKKGGSVSELIDKIKEVLPEVSE
jgi:CheY-like chemotaxis protein